MSTWENKTRYIESYAVDIGCYDARASVIYTDLLGYSNWLYCSSEIPKQWNGHIILYAWYHNAATLFCICIYIYIYGFIQHMRQFIHNWYLGISLMQVQEDMSPCLLRTKIISMRQWQVQAAQWGIVPAHKNIVRHTAHTIVPWPNPKQWFMIHTSGLMMIIR